MKKIYESGKGRCPIPKKLLLVMKLTAFLIVVLTMQVTATVYSQNKKLSLNMQGNSIKEVLQQIEAQSEYRFIYENEKVNLDTKVNIRVTDEVVENILKRLFEKDGINYSITENNLILINPSDGQLKSLGKESINPQQPKSVSGKVTDTSGTSLPGVSVVIKGTANGTITDASGSYSISKVSENATLIFSFVGMKSQEITVGGKTTISVALAEDAIGIEEVVAIGYGVVKKSDLTGAVGSVQGEVIANRQTTQISKALQGAISGVMVTRNNNAPGSSATIRVRGITTIGDSDPLVIVDGVPGSIDDINPNDVENVSVLKDAASSAIYGSRAAAGVILVTTKRAKSDQLNFEYNMEYGIERPTVLPTFVDVRRYMEITNELRWNDNGNTGDQYPIYSKDLIDNYHSMNAENPDLYPNTNWIDLILNDNAPRQSHILSITAGSKNIRTKASVAYDKTDGLYDGRTYERLTTRLNNDITVNKYFSATLDLNINRSISKSLNGQPIFSMWVMPPIYSAVWSDGRVAEGKIGVNPYASYKYGGFSNSWSNLINGKLSLDFTPLTGLKVSAVVSPSLSFNKSKNFTKKLPYYDWEDPSLVLGYIEGLNGTKLVEGRSDFHSITTQFLINYTKTYGDHSLNAMSGYENYYNFYEYAGSSSDQLELTSYPYLDLGNANYLSSNGNATETSYRSYFGRFMYNFRNRYFMQANIRYDGSSRFDEKYRWGAFPSFSVGWVMTEEPFMKNLSALSFLKLRGSWGRLGNERIGNYPYQSTIKFGSALSYQGSKITSVQTAAQTSYAIEDISWETTESFDAGIDANFFNNKLRFTGDYYKKTTKDMLLELEIPDYIGFDNPQQNTGKMNTSGWEIDLGWNDQIGELNYSVSANLSDFKSVMGDLGGKEFLGDQVKFEGSEFNEWYGYKSYGIFQTQEEVNSLPRLNASTKPGDVKYKDISGPNGVPDGKISSEYDRVLLGGSLPRYMYGGAVHLGYKNFDFSMVFQGVGAQNIRLSSIMVMPLYGNYGNIPTILDRNFWSKYNSDEHNLDAKYPRLTAANNAANYTMSDFWMANGAYFRIKSVTLGYNIPEYMTQKMNIKSVRVYTSISDFFTIDNYLKGWDPEVSTTGYPITASFILGVSVKF